MLYSYNSVLLFKIYITLATIMSLFITIIVTIEMWKVIKILLLVFMALYNNKSLYFNKWYLLHEALNQQYMYLLVISFLEYLLDIENSDQVYYNIAIFYQKMNYDSVAIYYYNQVSKTSCYFIQSLEKLYALYKKNNDLNRLNVVSTKLDNLKC